MVELSVFESCMNLMNNAIVLSGHRKSKKELNDDSIKPYPRVHGFVYDIGDGVLHEIDVDVAERAKLFSDIYAISNTALIDSIQDDD